MGCSCKVAQHISQIEKHYGTPSAPIKRSTIRDEAKLFARRTLLILIALPFFPLMLVFLLVRRIFTKKAINIHKLFKIKR